MRCRQLSETEAPDSETSHGQTYCASCHFYVQALMFYNQRLPLCLLQTVHLALEFNGAELSLIDFYTGHDRPPAPSWLTCSSAVFYHRGHYCSRRVHQMVRLNFLPSSRSHLPCSVNGISTNYETINYACALSWVCATRWMMRHHGRRSPGSRTTHTWDIIISSWKSNQQYCTI